MNTTNNQLLLDFLGNLGPNLLDRYYTDPINGTIVKTIDSKPVPKYVLDRPWFLEITKRVIEIVEHITLNNFDITGWGFDQAVKYFLIHCKKHDIELCLHIGANKLYCSRKYFSGYSTPVELSSTSADLLKAYDECVNINTLKKYSTSKLLKLLHFFRGDDLSDSLLVSKIKDVDDLTKFEFLNLSNESTFGISSVYNDTIYDMATTLPEYCIDNMIENNSAIVNNTYAHITGNVSILQLTHKIEEYYFGSGAPEQLMVSSAYTQTINTLCKYSVDRRLSINEFLAYSYFNVNDTVDIFNSAVTTSHSTLPYTLFKTIDIHERVKKIMTHRILVSESMVNTLNFEFLKINTEYVTLERVLEMIQATGLPHSDVRYILEEIRRSIELKLFRVNASSSNKSTSLISRFISKLKNFFNI